MSVIYIAIPVALVLAFLFVLAFVMQVKSGQYDDLQTPAQRMLFDDEPTTGLAQEPGEDP